ncbi:helix-turn-helix domain-containing protein [Sulfoacidibacillus ferrooxidans]
MRKAYKYRLYPTKA